MFPIGDDRIIHHSRPWVAWVLIAINAIVFYFELQLDEKGLEAFFHEYGATPAYLQEGQNLKSIFTSMFLHGGLMHIIGNMLFLYIFGDNIEAVLGHAGFLLFYLLGGVIASGAHIYFNLGSEMPSVGASGAISAVMGAYIVMFPRSRIRTLIFLGFIFTTARISAFIFLGIWFLLQLLNNFHEASATTEAKGGVAWMAHIGGFVFGLLAGIIFRGKAKTVTVERS